MLLRVSRRRQLIKDALHQCCSFSSTLNSQSSVDTSKLLTAARRFVEDEVLTVAPDHDRSGKYPIKIVKRAHALGLMNSDTSKQLGGLGLSLRQKCDIYETLAYGDLALGVSLMINELAQVPIIRSNDDHLLQKYVAKMTRSPLLAAYAVTEEDAGSDLVNAKLAAVEKNGDYVLNGAKAWICNAHEASWFFVLARTNADAPARSAFTGFIVDRDTHGVFVEAKNETLGIRAASTATIQFEDVRVPKTAIVGAVGDGFPLALYALKRTRPLLASLSCGIQQRALDEALKYAEKRKTFGRPIVEHEGVGFKLADMAQRLEATRLLARSAAFKVDEDAPDAVYLTSIAKCFAADAAYQTTSDAVQLLGANGYSPKFGVEKLLRDAKALALLGGSTEILRVVIARQLRKLAANK